jgi:hypothetical protein
MHGLVLPSGISTRQGKALTADPQRGIFTKIRQGNPAKASSDAVNPKPVAFIEQGSFRAIPGKVRAVFRPELRKNKELERFAVSAKR